MLFSDIFKKGFGAPAPSDLVEGGVGIDVQNKKAYSKGSDGNIFQLGLTDAEVQAIYDTITNTVTSTMPAGMVAMWSGSIATIPSGWALCDGNNGTPNLLNRCVIAAGSTYAVGATGNGTIPSHSHNADHNHTAGSYSAGSHSHTGKCYASSDGAYTSVYNTGMGTTVQHEGGGHTSNGGYYFDIQGPIAVDSNGSHSHTIYVNTKTMNTGTFGSGTAVVPIHYALAYIMKL